AEPDEEQLLHHSERGTRLRVFSSGVISNFITAAIAFSIFFYLLGFITPSIAVLSSDNPDLKVGDVVVEINGVKVTSPDDISKAVGEQNKIVLKLADGREVQLSGVTGVKIVQVVDGYPAKEAGIQEGWIITAVDGKKIHTLRDFLKAMEGKKGGDRVEIQVFDGSGYRNYTLTLKDANGRGLMGVQVTEYFAGVTFSYFYAENILNTLRGIPSMLTNPAGWLFLISMPIIFFNSFSFPITAFFHSSVGGWIFYALNTFYWIGWINFYVGLFNCLPAVPLDGGRVFYDVAEKLGGKRSAEIASKFLSSLIFGSIILSIVIPNMPR
ncbi:MAG: PDZ domain-containing protein, partial [Archaeoglobi archaeon]|nr:PDZ domain-containing protein [Archaeoglobi archaeon]